MAESESKSSALEQRNWREFIKGLIARRLGNENQRLWVVHFLGAAVSGLVVLSLLRHYPRAIHKYVNENFGQWPRGLICFLLSTVFVALCFKLFSPRLRHLRYTFSQPPIWLAWMLALLSLSYFDVGRDSQDFRLLDSGHEATLIDWLLFAILPLGLVSLYQTVVGYSAKGDLGRIHESLPLEVASNEALQEWLVAEEDANVDFFDFGYVAENLRCQIEDTEASVAVIGPFGSGKSSIVNWMLGQIDHKKYLIVRQSCWGIQDSASAINLLLNSALRQVESVVDTFFIRSLPEDYRKTIGKGGKWFDIALNLTLTPITPLEQFERLSSLLEGIDRRILFIIEDIDRNSAGSFEMQEFLAFLFQVKMSDRIQFVLVTGVTAENEIDLVKLTEHIEVVPKVASTDLQQLLEYVLKKSMEVVLTETPDLQETLAELDPLATYMLRRFEKRPIGNAVATLLGTPRSIRLVLRRTFLVWRDSLAGEVHWLELFLVNILRTNSLEAFEFLTEHWSSIVNFADEDNNSARLELLRSEWEEIKKDAVWDVGATESVLRYLLPDCGRLFGAEQASGVTREQSLQHERYWSRICRERLRDGEVPDNTIRLDISSWRVTKSTELPSKIASSREYCLGFEMVHDGAFIRNDREILELFEQVLVLCLEKHGKDGNWQTLGFETMAMIVRSKFAPEMTEQWLTETLKLASKASIGITEGLYKIWNLSDYPFHGELLLRLRVATSKALSESVNSFTDLSKIIGQHIWIRYALSAIIFDVGQMVCGDLIQGADWKWLGPILEEGIDNRDVTSVLTALSVVANRSKATRAKGVNRDLAEYFFGDALPKVSSQLTKCVQDQGFQEKIDSIDLPPLLETANDLSTVVRNS